MADGADGDLELLGRWRAGDRRAGSQLLRRHFADVRAFFCNKLPAEHEDLVQETFVQLVGSRDSFRGEASFRSYLFRIARNVFAEHLRRRYRQAQTFSPTSSSIVDVTGRRPSSLMVECEAYRLLLEALRTLPLDDQDLLELYYWQKLSGRELGSVLGICVGTVRSRLRAALDRLRRAYAALDAKPLGRVLEVDEVEQQLRAVMRHAIGRHETRSL